MSVAIGIDLGGGSVKCAVVDQDGQIIWPDNKIPIRVPYENDVNSPIDLAVPTAALEEALRRVPAEQWAIDTVGIAATGLVNADGKVAYGVSFRDYRDHDWSLVPRKLRYRNVHVTHDVRAAAWAEYVAQGRPSETMLHVTLGTGLGAACIIGGRFFYGADYAQGEIGYTALLNPPCDQVAFLLSENASDGTALGAGLTTAIHMINPKHVILAGFDAANVDSAISFFRRNAVELYRETEVLIVSAAPADIRHAAWEASQPLTGQKTGPLLYIARDGGGGVSSALVYEETVVDYCNQLGGLYVYAPETLELEEQFVYLEKYSGALGVEAVFTRMTGQRRAFKDIADSARTDPMAQQTLEKAGRILGTGLVTAIRIFNPQLITLGGAIPSIAPMFKDAAVEFLSRQLGQEARPQVSVGKFKNEAGIIGAALYALSMT